MGGGSSSCSKQDHIDPKPSIDLNVGLSIATSEACASCSLSFPLGNTASAAGMTRDKNTIVLRPFAPFVAVFSGRQFTFSELRIYHPAPMRIEGVQADAVVQCNSGTDLKIFIPIKKGTGIGSSVAFLSAMSQRLDPATSAGLGIAHKDSKEEEDAAAKAYKDTFLRAFASGAPAPPRPAQGGYEQFDIVTGQNWSLTNLVGDADPYFTWVDSRLEQYVRADLKCDRYLGWRSTPGPQVIYFQNPVTVSSADIDKLTATVGAVMPTSVLSVISHPLYSAGKANCPAPAASVKPPSSSSYGVNVTMIGNMFAYFISALLVLLAVAIVSFGVQSVTGIRLIGDVSATAKEATIAAKPSGDPSGETAVFGELKGLLEVATNPTAAAAAAAAGTGQAKVAGLTSSALSTAAAGQANVAGLADNALSTAAAEQAKLAKLANVTNALKKG